MQNKTPVLWQRYTKDHVNGMSSVKDLRSSSLFHFVFVLGKKIL